MDPGQERGKLRDRAPVRVRVPTVKYRIAGGVRAELHQQLRPSTIADLVPVRGQEQFPRGLGQGLPGYETLVLRRTFGDPLFQQGHEHVRLAAELRVDDPLGEAGLLGDGIHRGAAVAPVQEHAAGRVEHGRPVPLELLRAPQSYRHAHIRYQWYSNVNGIWIMKESRPGTRSAHVPECTDPPG